MRTNLRSTPLFNALTATLLGGLVIGAALTWAAPPDGKGGGGGDETPDISYSYIPLGTLGAMEGETPWSHAMGINNSGDVVGYTTTDYHFGSTPFLWTAAGGMIDLNALIDPAERKDPINPEDTDGWHLRWVGGINDWGQIAGAGVKYQNGEAGLSRAFRLDPPTETEHWTVVDLGNLLGANNGTYAAGINSSGDVAGYSIVGDDQYHMFLVLGDDEVPVMHDLGAYEGKPTLANSISNRTEGMIQIVGRTLSPNRALLCTCILSGDGISHEYQDLGTLRKDNLGEAEAWGVNDQGQIVGYAAAEPTKGNDNERAFLFGASGMVSLGTLSTGRTWNDSEAYDVNNHGEVVGECMTVYPSFGAFYYSTATGLVDLEQAVTNLPDSLRGLITPMAINDNGVVCGPRLFNGTGYYDREAFILTPNIPEL